MLNSKIYEPLSWVADLKDWPRPEAEKQPALYFVIIQDKEFTWLKMA